MTESRGSRPPERRTSGANCGVIGLGNPLRGDDGVVPVLFERIRAHGTPSDTDLLEYDAPTLRVVHALAAYDRVLLVDAVQFGGETGDHFRSSPAELVSQTDSNGSHEIELLEMVDLVGRMDEAPAVVQIFGIQLGQTGMEPGLSDELRERLAELQTALEEAIADL